MVKLIDRTLSFTRPHLLARIKKPEFLRKMADWVEEWESLSKMVETWVGGCDKKFSLSDSTAHALIVTLRCTANLIEELLADGFRYVLTARFQTDPLERRFSRYRQMSGGRFLVGLREVETTEKIIKITQLLKEDLNFWELEKCEESNEETDVFKKDLESMKDEISNCELQDEGRQVAATIAGYAVKKVIKDKVKCSECLEKCTAKASEANEDNSYTVALSRGGLILPSKHVTDYVSKGFAILDLCHETIKKSSLSSKMGGQLALDFNGIETNYILCKSHRPMKIFFNKIIINVFFNNYRKQQNGKIRKESVKQLKKRQLSKSK